MSNNHFMIAPKDDSLYGKVEALLDAYKSICQIPLNQREVPLILGQVILSGELNFGPEECLLLNSSNEVKDGFIIARRGEYLHNEQTVFDILSKIKGL